MMVEIKMEIDDIAKIQLEPAKLNLELNNNGEKISTNYCNV